MTEFPSCPENRCLLLSAGPRAGKTLLLRHWRSEAGAAAQYMALTPEDGDLAFFCHRLLQGWPDIRACYEELVIELPTLSKGALLGRAIAESHPDFCLLLDDFHLVERSPAEPELLAMCRQFPATGTLVIASRHQFPEIKREPVEVWGADHPLWQERPEAADLLALPEPLLAKALAVHLVGQAEPSGSGWELVRRNFAELSPERTMRLRACWQGAASLAVLYPLPKGLWEEVEQALRATVKKWLRTPQEQELQAILDRLPSEARRRHPYFLQLEGDLLLESGRLEAAQECYLQAIVLCQGKAEPLVDLKVRLAKLASRTQDMSALREFMGDLDALEQLASPLQRAQILNARGAARHREDRIEAAKESLQQVLSIPTCGDRSLEYEHFEALSRLNAISYYLKQALEATRYGKQAIFLASKNHFQKDLLDAYNGVNNALFLANSLPPPIRALINVPNDAFTLFSIPSLCDFVYGLAASLYGIDEFVISRELLQLVKEIAQTYGVERYVIISNIGLLGVCGAVGDLEEARRIYHELNQLPISKLDAGFLLPLWGKALSNARHFQEADEVLREGMSDSLPDHVRLKSRLYWLHNRHDRGDASALEEIKALLESPEGIQVWNTEAKTFHELGLRSLPPNYRIRAFGDLSFLRDNSPGNHWPRRKVLSLFALLVLHPEGIASDRLAEHLFGDPDDLESLHRAAYNFRQVLKSGGGEEILESLGGTYRLNWERIAFCDLPAFDALFEKAQSLEAEGILAGASTFYCLALILASAGSLFENLPDEFEEPRARYRARVRHAQAFLEQHQSGMERGSIAWPRRTSLTARHP